MRTTLLTQSISTKLSPSQYEAFEARALAQGVKVSEYARQMHENGADIRHIQALLGHEDIKTTQIYTQVAIRALQQVHAATHPAEARSVTQAARTAAEREGLLATLAADAEEDEE